MVIDIYEYRKCVVLELTMVKISEFLAFHELLMYLYINQVMKYWALNINKCIVNLWKLIADRLS